MAPKIYHLHPLVAGPLAEWPRHLARCRAMGFNFVGTAPLFAPGHEGDIFLTGDHETLHPALGANGSADAAIAELTEACADEDLGLILDVVADRVAVDAAIRRREPGWFEDGAPADPPDPRTPPRPREASRARFDDEAAAAGLAVWWAERLARLAQNGVAGFRCLTPDHVPPTVWEQIIGAVRAFAPNCLFVAWTPGADRRAVARLAGRGFDRVVSSLAWWDARASWFFEEAEALRAVAPSLGSPEPSFADRLAQRLDPQADIGVAYQRALKLAAATASGIIVPMGFEYATRRPFDTARAAPPDFENARQEAQLDLSGTIRETNALVDRLAALEVAQDSKAPALQPLTGPSAPVTALLRADAPDIRDARRVLLVLVNPDLTRAGKLERPLFPLPPSAGAAFGVPQRANGPLDLGATLAPGEVRLAQSERAQDIRLPWTRSTAAAVTASEAPRIAIEAVSPAVDGGAFAARRVVGESVTVSADVFADGHEMLGAELLWRCADEAGRRRVPMRLIGNDRFQADFVPWRVGPHAFTIEAWWDDWATFRRDLARKREAGQALDLEIEEGIGLCQTIMAGAPEDAQGAIGVVLERLESADPEKRVAILLDAATNAALRAGHHRPFQIRHPELPLEVDRPQALFASWYEMFPRSATTDPTHPGTLLDVITELPRIRDMGFDVLYFPPIHPIGTTNRKGCNNSLHAGPDDPGSPYAIGGPEGGHDAIDPALGTLADFRHLVAAAHAQGLEIALDYAIQCSLDHPWIRQNPGWFRWRPDGSVRYAENPPKKYEDIVNVDFYADGAIPNLWLALRDVVQFWIDQGVRIFRVDNPHTKPLPFWQWMIADIRARTPDVIFLAEAFTRPTMMYRLAKIGFNQSYTYFTWRTTKREIAAYLTELNEPPIREFFRPNFFVNTPDINPFFLQTSGRAGFLIRAALAATLSGLWGVYSGFELCESAPLPGREEYLDSEKYEIRVRDWDAPGNIRSEIAALNRIRRANPALQTHLGVTFYNAFNDAVLLFGKMAPSRHAMIFVAVSFDPHRVQDAAIEVPLWEWGLSDHEQVVVEDLMRGHRFVWTGKNQQIRLDPTDLPFAIWRIAPARSLR